MDKLNKSQALWCVNEVASKVGGVVEVGANGGDDVDIGNVSIDSREIEKGGLFLAVKGVQSDGHDYVEAAGENGALASIVKSDYKSKKFDGFLIRVHDTMEALNLLGRAGRVRAADAKIIAITGSVGKTSTKDMMAHAFASLGNTHASVKSYNNLWGVPLSLARMPRDTQYGIFEVGMNHSGEITPLTKLIQPHIAIITSVAPVHIGHFSSEEDIAKAKAEIFQGVVSAGAVLLPEDNPHFDRLKAMAYELGDVQTYSFGTKNTADCQLKLVNNGSMGMDVTARIFGVPIRYTLAMTGIHHAMNSLSVLGAVHLAGGDVEQAAKALSSLEETKGRGRRYHLQCGQGEVLLIDESYNANPLSVEVALKTLGQLPADQVRRRIALLGDMLELGEHSIAYHEGLAPFIDQYNIDLVLTAGDHMEALLDALPETVGVLHTKKAEDLIVPLSALLQAGDAVMVKGSFSIGMGKIVEALLKSFNKGAE